MPSYKTEAIIIKRTNFGEADKILTVFSKHYGKKKVIAKGVRRTTSRKGGNVELFNQVVLFLARGKTFDIVTEAQVVNSFEKFRKNLKRVGQAYYACELVDRLTAEDQEHRDVFDLLARFLEWLNCDPSHSELVLGSQPSRFRNTVPANRCAQGAGRREFGMTKRTSDLPIRSFEIKLLKLLGFWSRERIKDYELRIKEGVLERLEIVPFDQLRDWKVSSELLLELERFLKYYIERITEVRMKSSDFLNHLSLV